MKLKILLNFVIKLAKNKKNQKDKIYFLIKGVIFLPFLIKDLNELKQIDIANSHLHEVGGDIYPLF